MKFKSMKRFGSIVMAGAMALSLVVPAFAESAETPTQTVVDGGYVSTPISVVVPATGSATINPYGLPVVVSAKADGTAISISDQQITNVPMFIGNYGTTPLDVNATLAVLPKGDVSIKGGALATNTDKGKEMNVTLEIAGLNDDAYKQGIESEALVLALHEKFADDATWSGLTAANKLVAPAAAKGATSVATPAKSNAALATLGAATVNGEAVTYGAKSIALFRLVGEMNAEPKKTVDSNDVDDPWVAADGFQATIVFKFKPAAKTTVTVTVTGTATVAPPATVKAYEGDTVTITFKAATGKSCTAALTGMDGTAPTLSVTEGTGANAGTYTLTFPLPADDSTAGMGLTITIPA